VTGGLTSPRRNLELKARCRDLTRAHRVSEGLGAEDGGTLTQRDTYFEVPRGRLKLREELGGSHLIAYERPDLAEQKESRYRLVEISEPTELREVLAVTLGIRVVVSKTRHLFIFKGVRIHLDRVDGLGNFIEFEGVADGGEGLGRYEGLLVDLRQAFAILDGDLVRESYSDLLEAAACG
jgi:adenylate cyclase, class 2